MLRPMICAAALAAGALPALGADQLAAAWEAAAMEREGVITEAQFARLNVVAYHGAVASLCEGFALDEAEVAEATNAILQANPEGLSAEDLLARHVDILVAVGTARGLFLAEGSLHPEAFCAGAQRTRDLADFDDLWVD